MRRREFLALIGTCAWPLAADAQKALTRRSATLGILNYFEARYERVAEFGEALRELGYLEGQNLLTLHRWADGQIDRLPAMASELVASNADVIIAFGPATWAAKAATDAIPIVTAFSGDPLGMRLVPNLSRPGGNLTGFSYMSTELAAKRLELAREIDPDRATFAMLFHPGEPATKLEMEATEIAARTIDVQILALPVSRVEELDQAYATAAGERVGGVVVFTHGFAEFNRRPLVEAAARHRVPTIYGWRDFVVGGGLLSYGPDMKFLIRSVARYVDRIIGGEKPGDLPMQQPVRFELIVNAKTAATQETPLPPALLARADEVIE